MYTKRTYIVICTQNVHNIDKSTRAPCRRRLPSCFHVVVFFSLGLIVSTLNTWIYTHSDTYILICTQNVHNIVICTQNVHNIDKSTRAPCRRRLPSCFHVVVFFSLGLIVSTLNTWIYTHSDTYIVICTQNVHIYSYVHKTYIYSHMYTKRT